MKDIKARKEKKGLSDRNIRLLEDLRRTTYESELRLGRSEEIARRIAEKVVNASEKALVWAEAHF